MNTNEDEDDWRYAHGFFDHRQKIATAPKQSRTPSSGLETANQKEIFQSGTLTVEFVFTLLSQAFEDRHFTEREISFETLYEVRRIWIAASGLEDSARQKATVTRLRNTSAPFSCL